MNKQKIKYRCDGYYYSCENRGGIDYADEIRKDLVGNILPARRFCNNFGVLGKALCSHCVENKPRFKKKVIKHKFIKMNIPKPEFLPVLENR